MSDPRIHWEAIETEEEVTIPTADGQGIAEVIKVKVPAHRDPKTGEIYLSGEALQILDDVRARHTGLISREELRRLRERLGCTQKQICALLQIGEKTWTRWETGRERPSRSMNLLLLALNEGRIDIPWLLAQQHPSGMLVQSAMPMRQVVYGRPEQSYDLFIGPMFHSVPLPGFEDQDAVSSIWMSLVWPQSTEGNVSEPFANFPGAAVYHRRGSAPPWADPIAGSTALAARCGQSQIVPRPESFA